MLMLLKWRKWHLEPRARRLAVSLVATSAVAAGLSQPAAAATVTVEPGQNLTEIADLHGVSVEALAAANGITDPNRVLAGSHLTIPGAGAGPGMQLASYSLPAADDELPAQLLANPGRLSLEPDFVRSAQTYGVPAALLEAMCWWESGWQEDVVSAAGAIGVCQIEPSTAAYVDDDLVGAPLEPTVTSQNIALGAALLGSLLRSTGGNVGQALAGYYQGLASVRQRGMLPTTAIYVRGVEAYATIFSSAG